MASQSARQQPYWQHENTNTLLLPLPKNCRFLFSAAAAALNHLKSTCEFKRIRSLLRAC